MAAIIEDPSQPIRCTPDGEDGPAYLLRVPRRVDVTAYRRQLWARDCRYPGDIEMLTTLIGAVKRLMTEPEDAAQRDRIVTAVEQHRDAMRLWIDGKGERPDAVELVEGAWNSAMADPIFAGLIADRVVYPESAALVTVHMFLVGWEGPAEEFRRTSAGVPDDLLDLMPEEHILAIGTAISERLILDKEARKNFGSRRGGAAAPLSSSSSATRPKKRR